VAKPELDIIIMGAGEVGKGLARRLINEGHQIRIIDVNQTLLSEIESQLDMMGVLGNGASADILIHAGIEKADFFIGVSDNDECNLLACALAKQFGVRTTICRVRKEDYLYPNRDQYAQALQIDLVINPDEVASLELFDLLENPVAQTVTDFAEGRLKLVGFKCDMADPICNRTLMELPALGFEGPLLIASLVRNNEVLIPRGDTRVLPGDQVYVVAAPSALGKVNEMGGVRDRQLNKVIMVGASRVSFCLAEKFEDSDVSLFLIERDEQRCQRFAEELKSTTVLHGDGTDISILNEAGISEADGFIAASDDDETNILSTLLAKERGAKRVIALLRKPQYLPLLEHIKPIDVAVNPRVATINAIMRYVRQGRILSMATLAEERAEAMEVEVQPGSHLIGKRLKDHFLPRNVLLGAIVRENAIIIPRGHDQLEENDRVVVIALKADVSRVDETFSVKEPETGLRSMLGSVLKKKT
jgi:trk system potassium uptake protein TrkA